MLRLRRALALIKRADKNGEQTRRSNEDEQDKIDQVVLIWPDAASCDFRPSARKPPWTIHVLPRFDLL
jgi:hypothetical protein